MDAFGHVNNVVFVRYLEEARIDFMFRLARQAGSGGEGDHFTGGSVVARHEVDYVRPLTHRHEPVTIEIWVTRIGAASADFAYEIKDPDTCYVRATTRIVPFDLAGQRPRRLTPEEKVFLKHYLEEGAARSAGTGAAGEAVPAAADAAR